MEILYISSGVEENDQPDPFNDSDHEVLVQAVNEMEEQAQPDTGKFYIIYSFLLNT